MNDQGSILEKIIQNKQIEEATQFNPAEVISNLFKNLSVKEKDILARRFGLFDKDKDQNDAWVVPTIPEKHGVKKYIHKLPVSRLFHSEKIPMQAGRLASWHLKHSMPLNLDDRN